MISLDRDCSVLDVRVKHLSCKHTWIDRMGRPCLKMPLNRGVMEIQTTIRGCRVQVVIKSKVDREETYSKNRESIMRNRFRRNYTPTFKARVAIAALKSEQPLATLASKLRLHPNQITRWKSNLLERAPSVFDRRFVDANLLDDPRVLLERIEQLTLENDFLESALSKVGMLSAKR